MTVVLRTGVEYRILSNDDIEVFGHLPAANYVAMSSREGFYLTKADDFKLPEKIYGSVRQRAERILNTFESRQGNTGVHFCGEKGSGKSMLAKMIGKLGRERGLPTIIINSPYIGDDFNNFMQGISTPAIVIFDEFEKTYKREEQEAILTLLDGVFSSKKLFIFTTNNSYGVSSFLKNRPGRIYYQFEFQNLEEEFVREYCMDNLLNKEHIETVIRFTKVFSGFNFDMLQAAVEEMNRYNEPFETVLKYLNIEPEFSRNDIYQGVAKVNGKEIPLFDEYHGYDYREFSYWIKAATFEKAGVEPEFLEAFNDLRDSDGEININPKDLTDINGDTGVFVYKLIGDDNKVIEVNISKRRIKPIDYTARALSGKDAAYW